MLEVTEIHRSWISNGKQGTQTVALFTEFLGVTDRSWGQATLPAARVALWYQRSSAVSTYNQANNPDD